MTGGVGIMTAGLLAALAVGAWLPPGSWERLGRVTAGSGTGGPRRPGALTLGADGVADLADRLAAGVEAGLALPVAWTHALGESTLPQVSSRDPVSRSAAAGLRGALELGERLGIAPSGALRAVAAGVRDARAADDARAAAVAGPLAGARIVACLPLAGPVVAAVLGVDPLQALTGTGWGRTCLVAGLLFLALGAWWSRRLVHRARMEAWTGR